MKNVLIIMFGLIVVGANAQTYSFELTGMYGHDNLSGKDTDFIKIKPIYFTLDMDKAQYTDFDRSTHKRRVSSYSDFYSDDSYDVYIRFKISFKEEVEIILDKEKKLLRHNYTSEDVSINYIIGSVQKQSDEEK